VVGGGPAGMFAAWCLSSNCEVHLFEQSSSLGRKLLVAGKGGLNITNYSIQKIREVYIPEGFMNRALDDFDNNALLTWLHNIGIPTYIGSSGKVFPEKGIKTIEVVQKMTNALLERNVTIHLNHRLISFASDNMFSFEQIRRTDQNRVHTAPIEQIEQIEHSTTIEQSNDTDSPFTKTYTADYCILALGGASWPQTGSDGLWVNMFRENAIHTLPFLPSNCGINIEWPPYIRQFHSGKPLKNITISVWTKGEETAAPLQDTMKMQEALITDYGLEGAAIYGIVPNLRTSLAAGTKAYISIDFKPKNSMEQLLKKVSFGNSKNTSRTLKRSDSIVPDYKNLLSLNTEQMALIKAFTQRDILTNREQFCMAAKNLIIPVQSLRPIDEAISVVGGISINDINENFSLKSNPSIFVIGEMVNWDAPTGGFLLQGCFSMAALAANSIIKA